MNKTETKRRDYYKTQYENSSDTELSDVYKSYNNNKKRAYDKCIDVYFRYKESNNARRCRILTHNLNEFTFGFKYDNSITGVLMLCIITKSSIKHYEY